MATAQHTEKTMWQHVCVASLVGHCESIAARGQLDIHAEQSLRLLIAETLSAFSMQSHDERNAA